VRLSSGKRHTLWRAAFWRVAVDGCVIRWCAAADCNKVRF
jgi:hypothetical protein